MKHIIYVPAVGEVVPDGAMTFTLLDVGQVIGAMVADDFTTAGTVLYDSAVGINDLADPASVPYFDGYPIL